MTHQKDASILRLFEVCDAHPMIHDMMIGA
jgi:hypothetical protein